MVKLVDCGNTVKVTRCSLPKTEQRIKILDGDHYQDLLTGEIKEIEHAETKAGTLASVRRAFGRLKDLVNTNYSSPENVVLLTLTYAQNMQDQSCISGDMAYFFRKLRAFLSLPFEYIYVKETQGRGAWHMHIILFFESPAPVLSPRACDVVWGLGMTDWRNFSGDINNLGQYLSARLVNHGETDKKGLRILNYPAGMHIYARSRGIKDPVYYDMPDDLALEFLQARNSVLRTGITDSILLSCDMTVEYSRYLFTVDPLTGCAGFDNSRYVNYRRTSY